MSTATTARPSRSTRARRGSASAIEAWLDERGVTYEYVPDFPLADIDRERSLANQARMGEPIRQAVRERYAEAMRRGEQFPPIVLARAGARAKVVVVDGNHRFVAAVDDVGAATHPAYVIHARPDARVVTALTLESNSRHGLPSDEEERIQHAIYLIRSGAANHKVAAAMVNAPLEKVQRRWEKVKADDRAVSTEVPRSAWEALTSAAVKARLAQVSTDEGFVEAAKLAAAAGLTVAEVDELVGELNRNRSAAKQVALVKSLRRSLRDRIAARAGGPLGSARRGAANPRHRFVLAVNNLLALPDEFAPELVSLFGDDERSTAAQQARDAAARLEQLAVALES